MARIPARRAFALVLLALLVTFALPPAPAAAAPSRSPVPAPSGSWWASPAFWQGLVAGIPHLGGPVARWLRSSCGIDPNGNPLCGAKAAGDRGCGADPDGQSLCGTTSVYLDSGCGADPNGQPLCGSH